MFLYGNTNKEDIEKLKYIKSFASSSWLQGIEYYLRSVDTLVSSDGYLNLLALHQHGVYNPPDHDLHRM